MASPRPRCGGPEHAKAVNLAFFAILLYPIGIPALYLLLLFCARGAILRDRPTRLSSALSFLHRDFEARMYGWEIAEQFKKLFLVGIMVRVRPDTIVQLGVAIIFCLVFMLGSAIAKPYRREENDYFAVACNFSLTAVFVFCTMLKVKSVSETLEAGELYDRLYFDEFVIGGCLSVCVFGALILAGFLSLQSIVEAAQVPTLRLVSTGNRPELTLAKGHKWHLFLSHIWGTGQDQCATIKRQLSLLLTGVSVFLDVDDLEDIGALEEYIEQTSTIMIFVSKGYFKSKNCLREARCAVSKVKPLSLVHDPVRGGGSLKSISNDECPTEYYDHILTGRPVITYHRIKDFQVVSIKLLAQDVLLNSPAFARKDSWLQRESEKEANILEVQLALPGELTRKGLSFERPITVYVSAHNPGAAVVMEALQGGFLELQEPKKKLSVTGMPSMASVARGEKGSGEDTDVPADASADVSAACRASEQGAGVGASEQAGRSTKAKDVDVDVAQRAKAARGQIRATATPPTDVQGDKEIEGLIGELSGKKGGKKGLEKKGANEPTHMLLYLNSDTFVGDKGELFANEVRAARANGFPLVMVHENDEDAGGCDFARFFETTPQDLISDGLYKALAYAWYPDPFRQVSVALVALAFGAEEPLSRDITNQVKRVGKRALRDLSESWATCLAHPRWKRHRDAWDSTVRATSFSAFPKAATASSKSLDPEAQTQAQAAAGAVATKAPRKTKTVELVRTPLGLGLTVDSEFKVAAITEDSQAQRSGSFAVEDQLVSLNGRALSGGGSFDEQLQDVAVGTTVQLEVVDVGRNPVKKWLGSIPKTLSKKMSSKAKMPVQTEEVVVEEEESDDEAPDGGWL